MISDRIRLFHPKLYLFGRHKNGRVGGHAWVGSANFTTAGFGGHTPRRNEEIIVETGPGKTTDALVAWFEERWNRCPTDRPVTEMIRRYTEHWEQNPPDPDFRRFVCWDALHRSDLLDDAHRPLTLQEYRQALKKCEEMLQVKERDWEVLDPRGRSYVRAIAERQRLLLGEGKWSQFDRSQLLRLTGGVHGGDSGWWGLLAHESPHFPFQRQITPKTSRYTRCSSSIFPNVSINGRTRSSDQLGRW